jgi:hypothetical protein
LGLKFSKTIIELKFLALADFVFKLNLGRWICTFSFLSSQHHFVALFLIWSKRYYINWVEKGIGYLRWYEYSVSSSMMIVLISMMSGVTEISTLFLIFCMNACMNMFGLAHEVANHKRVEKDWHFFIFGCLCAIACWLVIGVSFFSKISLMEDVPTSMISSAFSLLIIYFTFPVNFVLHHVAIGPYQKIEFSEQIYIILSFVSKTILAWQIYAYTLQFEK